MNKYQLKERSLILLSFAMINEGFRLIELDPKEVGLEEFEDAYDMKLVQLFRKLEKLNKMFATKKVLNFLDKRLAKVEDELESDCQPLYIGLLLLYFYKQVDIKKDLVIVELDPDDIVKVINDYHEEFRISECTINKVTKLFLAIYPDKQGYIEWLQISNIFPYNIRRSNV